jgi:hypothetical protein
LAKKEHFSENISGQSIPFGSLVGSRGRQMVDEPWLGAPQFGDCLGTHLGQAGAVLLKQGQVGQLRGIFPKVVEFLDLVFLEGTDVFVATIVQGSVLRHLSHLAQFLQVGRYRIGIGAVFAARKHGESGALLCLLGLLQQGGEVTAMHFPGQIDSRKAKEGGKDVHAANWRGASLPRGNWASTR